MVVVVGDEEESAVQWREVEVAVLRQQRLHRPLLLGEPVGLLCWISGRKKSKTRLSLAR